MNNQTLNPTSVPRLITIAISHYCEKVRWALDWLEIPYKEENHAPPFHRSVTRRYGGTTVPVLVTESSNYTDSTKILQYLDAIAPDNRRLYPNDSKLRQEVEELEELFDTQLGVSTRSWAYHYTIDNPMLLRRLWCRGIPWIERVGFEFFFPYVRQKVRKGYNTSAFDAANSLEKIREIFETVNRRLALSQEYLVGNDFTAADLTFAALSAPVIRPARHPIISSRLRGIPEEMKAVIEELRKTPAGMYTLRLYKEQRHLNSEFRIQNSEKIPIARGLR